MVLRYLVTSSAWWRAWWILRVALAYALMPATLALHGLRELGGADPDRRDAAKTVRNSFEMDGPAQPLPFLAAWLICAAYVVVPLILMLPRKHAE